MSIDKIQALPEELKPDPFQCRFCYGKERVEWSGTDSQGNPEEGVYDPCPMCDPNTLSGARYRLHLALHQQFHEVAVALGIDRLVEWLSARLSREGT